jgi:hypothetical protein
MEEARKELTGENAAGYVPLRSGHRRDQQSLERSPCIKEGVPSG